MKCKDILKGLRCCVDKTEPLFFSLCLGKYYYEVSCHDQGLCRIGWSTNQASLDLGMNATFFFFHSHLGTNDQEYTTPP